MDREQFRARIDQIHHDLDAYTYYELLNVAQTASVDEIQQAFHRMALTMHPDRHQRDSDQQLRSKLYAIYKRLAEGYRVLSNHQTRMEYDSGLVGGQRRLVKVERKRNRNPEDELPANAKRFYRMAQEAERRGDRKNARINYKFALDLAPASELIKERTAALDDG